MRDGDESQNGTARIRAVLEFVQEAERLKDTLRSGFTRQGSPESVAEHSWRLCLLVILFEKELQGLDMLKLLKLCILHDLGEALSGDVPAIHQTADNGARQMRERLDLVTLCKPLPVDLQGEVLALWDVYCEATTPEAIFAKGFDKIETMLQHVIGGNPADFDYAFNLGYGRERTEAHPLLAQIRELVDEATTARAKENGQL